MPALFKHQIRQNYRYLLVIQNLNHFLFPNIFPDGHGHYNEVKIHNEHGASISITYGKYILNTDYYLLIPDFVYIRIGRFGHAYN